MVLALLWLLGCGSGQPDWRPMLSEWSHPAPLPALPFRTADGLRTLADLRGQWTLVGFVFTRCGNAEACPLTMQRLAVIQEALGDDLQIAVFTLDPRYDTLPRLVDYGQAHGLDADRVIWGALPTGEEPELLTDAIPSLFNVYVTGDGPQRGHPTRVTLVDPQGREAAHWEAAQLDPASVRAAIAP